MAASRAGLADAGRRETRHGLWSAGGVAPPGRLAPAALARSATELAALAEAVDLEVLVAGLHLAGEYGAGHVRVAAQVLALVERRGATGGP